MSGTTAEGIGLPFREAIAFFRGKANQPTQHWTDVWQEGHSRSFMVAGAATDALLNDFRGEIQRALEQGTTLADFRKAFPEIVARHGWAHNGSPGWRSRIIFETNLSTAYAAGRYAQQTEPDTLAAFPYWQYVHSRAQHPRRQHQAWDGLVLRADDPFWRTHYPPNGWRCGCRVRPLSGRDLARQGKAATDASPEIRTREWRNPRTGAVSQVPEGIDPGFAYNPGQAWRGGAPELPADARTRVPPASFPPPAPGTDPGPAWRAWLADREAAGYRPDGSAQILGEFSARAAALLAARRLAPESRVIAMTAQQLRHVTRKVKGDAGRAISMQDLRRLPELVAAPEAVLLERATGNILLVFTPASSSDARRGKLVVHLDFVAKVRDAAGVRLLRRFNGVKSGGLVPAARLRDTGQYERIEGDV